MMERGPAHIWLQDGGLIDFRFERRGKTLGGRRIRSWPSRGRHQSSPQLSNHFFDTLSVLLGMRQIDGVPRESAGLQVFVVTTGTVLTDKGTLSIDRQGRRAVQRGNLSDALSGHKNNESNGNGK